ncbi:MULTISPECIES: hypothetical protein [Terasakiella]|uniref:Uncharacterized protein n=1 Tax=Terasakiella brassicae TaxID=1634917 RepID=A0A917C0N1_9PROT|nr:hypothetical protein [Terasakiella brassicae]GGF62379.1 hypothetical protein GCM10011332_15280 [Terasakiella brassicae]
MLLGLNILKSPKEKVELPVIGPYGSGGQEPKLKELLDDPIIHLIAKSDKIAPHELAGCVEQMRKKIGSKH